MNRRGFLKIASSGITLSPWLEPLVHAAEAKTADLRDLFETDDPEVLALAQRVFDQCVFQDRWNQRMPAYARDMVTVAIKTAPQEVRQFSQIPILAWGVERVYQRNRDQVLLEQCLGRLERFHDWFWRERDVTNLGLIAVGSYSGILQHARWETFDYPEHKRPRY